MPKDNKKNISPFSIDVLKLVTGTTIAQAIGILASPILTRLYGPEAFGLFAIFTSITSIIGVIACMRYELAIMLPERDEDAINILGLCMLMVVVITVFTTVIIFFGGGLITNLLQASGLKTYLWLVPPFVFISGIFLALNYWNSRTRQFGRLSVARITNSFGTTTVQLGAGLSGFTSGGSLIGAGLVGMLVSTGVLGLQIWRDDDVKFKKSVKWRGIIKVMKRYKKFPLIDSISALLNTISWQLPVILLSAFFSPVIVGFYALGMRVLQLPMSFIGGALAQVFFSESIRGEKEQPIIYACRRCFQGTYLDRIISNTNIDIDWGRYIYSAIWSNLGRSWYLYSDFRHLYVCMVHILSFKHNIYCS